MDGKNKIIQRILDDASAKCQDILDKAQCDSASTVDMANKRAEQEMLALQQRCTQEAQAIVDNALSNAKLSVAKYSLNAKQNMIASVYTRVRDNLHQLSSKQYLALITKLINTHAENGEVVTISAKDAKVITASYLDSFKLGLVLDKQYGDFDGGIVLSTDKYDKVLTLDRLVQDIARASHTDVAKILFSGE